MIAHNFSRAHLALALASVVFVAFPSFAQDSPPATTPPAAEPQQPMQVASTIKKESRLVLVDTVVTDKKGNYIHDLSQGDFKVYEDNKEQTITSFSNGASSSDPQNSQKHYLVLFFDNSSMALPDQISARAAATKFIDSNVAPDHLMAVVEFGGSLRIVQNFTANAELLQAAAKGVKSSYVASNADTAGPGASTISTPGIAGFTNAATDYGARSMLLSVRTLAKNLRSIPGRKMLVLFSSGFPLTAERQSELTATIDACNKSNVAVYSLDVRGLQAPAPKGGAASNRQLTDNPLRAASSHRKSSKQIHLVRLVLASYAAPQRPGGGGGWNGASGTTGGKRRSGGSAAPSRSSSDSSTDQKNPIPAVAHATHRSSEGIAGTSATHTRVAAQKNSALRPSGLRPLLPGSPRPLLGPPTVIPA